MKAIVTLTILLAAAPAGAQSHVYTNADLGRPIAWTNAPATPQEAVRVLRASHSDVDLTDYRSQPPADGPRIVIMGRSTTPWDWPEPQGPPVDYGLPLPWIDSGVWYGGVPGAFVGGGFGRGRFDAFGRGRFDAFGRGGFDAFGRGGFDAFGRGGFDAFGRGPFDAFGRDKFDAFGRDRFDAFGRERFDTPPTRQRHVQPSPSRPGGGGPPRARTRGTGGPGPHRGGAR